LVKLKDADLEIIGGLPRRGQTRNLFVIVTQSPLRDFIVVTEVNLVTKAGAFLRFWLHSIRQAFNYGWVVFGAISNLLPVVLWLIQLQSWGKVGLPQWVANNQAESQVIGFAFSALVYLCYAPYKQFKMSKEGLSSQIAALQNEKQELLTNHQSEVAKLRAEIEDLKTAANDKSRKEFDTKVTKLMLGEFLMQLQDQEFAVRKLFDYSYDDAAQGKANSERVELLNRILEFLDKNVSRGAAAIFRGAKGSPIPADGEWNIFTDKINAKRAMVADLEAHYLELKKILENVD